MRDLASALHLVIAVLVAAPLLYAGTTKLLEPLHFRAAAPKLVPQITFTDALVRGVGACELVVGALCVSLADPVAAWADALAYGVLAVLMLGAVRRGESGTCGCFGGVRGSIGAGAVVRNCALLVAAAALATARATALLAPYELAVGVVVSAILCAVAVAVDTAISVRRARS